MSAPSGRTTPAGGPARSAVGADMTDHLQDTTVLVLGLGESGLASLKLR